MKKKFAKWNDRKEKKYSCGEIEQLDTTVYLLVFKLCTLVPQYIKSNQNNERKMIFELKKLKKDICIGTRLLEVFLFL